MYVRQKLRFCLGVIASCALSFVAVADPAEPSANAQAAFLLQNDVALKQLAADYLSQRFDFLDVKYTRPDLDGKDGWAIAYRWDIEKSSRHVGVQGDRFTIKKQTYSLYVDGNYALGTAKNTGDLSTVLGAFRMERGDLGKLHYVGKRGIEFQNCIAAISDPSDPNDEAGWRKVQQDEDTCWSTHGIDQIVQGEDTAYYYWVDFHAGVEGNQNYSDTHSLFGLNAAIAVQPSRTQAKYNPLDWPFRLLRSTFDTESRYVAPYPSLRLSVEKLNANDAVREQLTSDNEITRATAEVAWQSRVANVDRRPVRFTFSYRYFYELDAPAAIKDLGRDGYSYMTASLRFPTALLPTLQATQYEFFVAYNKGRLPFDLSQGESVAIGISTNLKVLGTLLGQ